MKKCPFTKASFVKTAIDLKDYPILRENSSGKTLVEVATAGRSNVGKSSLLNHLFRSKNLVKTSSTPGKTQALNFFSVNEVLSFVDLPGYGYANVPAATKRNWGPMTETYIRERKELKLILFLLDIRRVPNDDDRRFLEWAMFHNKALILVLTKIDKVTQQECAHNTKKIVDLINLRNLHYVHYSVPKNRGRDQLIHLIHETLEDEQSTDEAY